MLMKNGLSCHKLRTKLDKDISKRRIISDQINKSRPFTRIQGSVRYIQKAYPTYLPPADMILQTN